LREAGAGGASSCVSDYPRHGQSGFREHRCVSGEKGGMQVQGIGRCCGGRMTRIHPVTDECDRPLPTGDTTARSCAHGSDNNGAIPVIPPGGCHKEPPVFDRKKYRLRNVVERTFCRLKDFRRISTTFA